MRSLVLFLVLSQSAVAATAFDVATFKPRKLSSWEFSIRYSKLFPKSDGGEAVDKSLTSLRSLVHYTGVERAVPAAKSHFISRLGLGAKFTREIQVEEDGFRYWVAVQDPVFPHLAQELRVGEPFHVYYHFAGVSAGRQPVYLLVEFDSPIAAN